MNASESIFAFIPKFSVNATNNKTSKKPHVQRVEGNSLTQRRKANKSTSFAPSRLCVINFMLCFSVVKGCVAFEKSLYSRPFAVKKCRIREGPGKILEAELGRLTTCAKFFFAVNEPFDPLKPDEHRTHQHQRSQQNVNQNRPQAEHAGRSSRP